MIKHYSHKSTHAPFAAAVFLLALVILLRPVRAGDGSWGEVIDPDKDCHLVFADGILTCTIPGTDHALAAEEHRMNAPRVLAPVSGDFAVQVKVTGEFPANVSTLAKNFAPWEGAGLLLWQDADNYVRFERAQLVAGSAALSYAVFEARINGKVDRYSNAGAHPVQSKYSILKMERHGATVSAAISPDGLKWDALEPKTLHWPQTLQVGVSASHDTSTPFTVEFADFKLSPLADTAPRNDTTPAAQAPTSNP